MSWSSLIFRTTFVRAGSCQSHTGTKVVPLINRLAERFSNVVLTQDWHPPDHLSFASTHPGRRPFEMVTAAYGPQVLWPDHCVQGSMGADFHKVLSIPHAGLEMRKGTLRTIDSI